MWSIAARALTMLGKVSSKPLEAISWYRLSGEVADRSQDETTRVWVRVFDAGGSSEQISDFAIPEWRMAVISSLLLARLGDERRALATQDDARRTLP
ncbi:hypothetical protein [Allorhizocola rhizosphaerae]|uniref:hypothetical protein n=1 Tax=Allorhizocola rhizosphaerae TaxID=1872709 RepID=UPI000E3EC51D|nr:hypothetical protein [Allorhizocola rhizosphaerae]